MLIGILHFAVTVLGALLLLRAYVWTLAISPRDPLVRFVWKWTDWIVNPVAYLVRPKGNLDLSTLAAALILAFAYTLLLRELTGSPATPEAFFATPLAMMACWAIELLTWGLIIYCVLSFAANPMSGTMALLYTLIDPFLRPFRRFIPLIGRFDVSPIVLFLILNFVERFLYPVSRGFLFF